MNTRQVMDLLRELDDPAAHASAAGTIDVQLAEARRRGHTNPPAEVEPGGWHPHGTRRRLVATLITAAVLAAATVSVAAVVVDHHRAAPADGASTSTPGGGSDRLPPVEQVTSTETVIADQRDSLAPLVSGDPATIDIDHAIAAVRGHDAEAGRFLDDPAVLDVREGLYTNPGLLGTDGKPTVDVPVFAIRGGHATCSFAGKYSGVTTAPSTPRPCTATLVVDAQTGALLVIEEQSHE